MASLALPPPTTDPTFDPAAWLDALTSIGGGYALGSSGRLHLLVRNCDASQLLGVVAEIAGRPERRAAVKRAIEQRQAGEE